MRGKRAKQYRKLMHQYSLAFNFREPYQVLIDAEMVQDTTRFRMDLPHLLERTLHGKIKPMITQCSIRHLYLSTHENKSEKSAWIETAKTFERRRCGHHELEQPLSTLECLTSVVDPKETGHNKHRYVVASQDADFRGRMRQVAGVPLIYVSRSVMVMEPMTAKTEAVRTGQEVEKIRAGVKRGGPTSEGALKRKRSESEDDEGLANGADGSDEMDGGENGEVEPVVKKSKKKGPKGPNPLSVKKSKKRDATEHVTSTTKMPDRIEKQIRAARQQASEDRKKTKATSRQDLDSD